MKTTNPLIDVAAILICILAVVVIGQYYIAKKDKETIFQVPQKHIEVKAFESKVKVTE